MTEQQRQHLSALVDGEIDPVLLHPTLSALESNPDLAETWERYHLIGQALRREPIYPEYRNIATAVRARVAEEPVPLTRPARRTSRAGPFAGAALAAAAAFLAVFAVPQLFDPSLEGRSQTLAVSSVTSPPPQFQLAPVGKRWNLEEPELKTKLDRFLVNHQAYTTATGIKGFLPYATVVGYEAGQ